jgi:hypothetical protein
VPANIFIQRLAFTIGALLVYRVGCAIPVPGLDADLLNLMSRAPSIERLSIFALGVAPIFSALLIFEFLKLVFPPLARWEAAERTHARRLHNVVYIVAVAMAAIQAYGVAIALYGLPQTPGEPESVISIAATMIAGVMLLGWLGDRINRHGLGTGFWLILIVPMLIALPSTMAIAVYRAQQGAFSVDALVVTGVFLLVALAAAAAMVLLDRQRRAVPAAAEKPQYRISGPDFALVWPPLFAVLISNFVMATLSWPESAAAQGGLIAALLLVLTGLQTLGAARNEEPGKRLLPWIIAAVQIFICLGCDIAAEKLQLPIRGEWLIVVVVTMMNLLRDSPPAGSSLRPNATPA